MKTPGEAAYSKFYQQCVLEQQLAAEDWGELLAESKNMWEQIADSAITQKVLIDAIPGIERELRSLASTIDAPGIVEFVIDQWESLKANKCRR